MQLDQPYVLEGFGIYDTFGTGSVKVYDAKTDTLLWETNLGSYMTRSIACKPDSAPTDLLKIIKGDGAINELVLYGYPAAGYPDADCNADGGFNSKDLTELQNWLLTKDRMLANWIAADLTGDLAMDARDFTRMKRMLMK